jgi:hypothetical protein
VRVGEQLHDLMRILKNGACTDGAVLDSGDAHTCVLALERYIKQEEGLMRYGEVGRGQDEGCDTVNAATQQRAYASDPCGYDFSWALQMVKSGRRVARHGWNGRDMYIAVQTPDAHSKMGLPYLYLRTVQGALVPWLASQTDLLASDWHDLGPV